MKIAHLIITLTLVASVIVLLSENLLLRQYGTTRVFWVLGAGTVLLFVLALVHGEWVDTEAITGLMYEECFVGYRHEPNLKVLQVGSLIIGVIKQQETWRPVVAEFYA